MVALYESTVERSFEMCVGELVQCENEVVKWSECLCG